MFNQVVYGMLKCAGLQLIQVIDYHHFGLIQIVRDEIWHIGFRIRFDPPILSFSWVILQSQRVCNRTKLWSGFVQQ